MLSRLAIAVGKSFEHRRIRGLTRAEFEALKLRKFRRLARYANDRSEYYAKIVHERGIDVERCVPSDFPVLTKSALAASFDAISTDRNVTKRAIAEFLTRSHDPRELFLNKYRVIHTSGSSGEVGYFVYSPDDWLRGVLTPAARRRNSTPRKTDHGGRPRMAYYGATDGHYAGITMVASYQRGLARLFVEIETYEINTPLPEVIDALNAFQPDYLTGYTTALKVLAAKQREGRLNLSLIGVGTAGESTSEADRAVLEQAFDCGVTNTYGCSEHLMMGIAPPGSREMVLYDTELIYELYPDHSIVTNLFNYTLPLIRYRMSDVLRPTDSPEHVPYLVIEGLVGRTELQPTFKNRDGVEDFISPHTINEIFVAGVTRFQMQLVSDSRFRFVACLDPLLRNEQRAACIHGLEARLREILERKRMNNVVFEVLEADDIPLNPQTRKFQLIVDARG